MKRKSFIILASVAAALAVLAIIISTVRSNRQEVPASISCAIAGHHGSRELLAGYNYALLHKYARHTGKNISVSYIKDRQEALDSLKKGTLNLVAFPWKDSLVQDFPELDSMTACGVLDSSSVWLTGLSDRALAREVETWLLEFQCSDEHEELKQKYWSTFNPYRSRRREYLSPYDSLFRHHADSIGWDWRLLAAVAWHESHFHIEASSRRGARGIMQLVPSTADRFGVVEPLDPEQSIKAASDYLAMLQKRFRKVAANPAECRKYTLAAYNAGEGRIDNCIDFARSLGIDPSFWCNTASIIPLMSSSEVLDSVQLSLRIFSGKETLRYVDEIFSIYNEFCRICPTDRHPG